MLEQAWNYLIAADKKNRHGDLRPGGEVVKFFAVEKLNDDSVDTYHGGGAEHAEHDHGKHMHHRKPGSCVGNDQTETCRKEIQRGVEHERKREQVDRFRQQQSPWMNGSMNQHIAFVCIEEDVARFGG